jgi:hypothetical protein
VGDESSDKRATIIALITALLGLSTALIECSAKNAEAARRAEADTSAKQSAEQASAATDRANRAEAARQKLAEQQDSVRRFMANYASHLQDIKNKQSRLDEISRSRSQEGLGQAQSDLTSSVQSYVKFVKDWRTVHRELASLLDGDVTAMEDAAAVGDLAEIQRHRDVLTKNISRTSKRS